MPVNTQQLRRRLRDFDFTGVMVEELGWNYHQANPVPVVVDGQIYDLIAVAEKSGLVVYSCGGDADGRIPPYPVRQKIERQVAKATFEHLVIFHDAARTTQYWQWVRRQAGKPAAWREQVYRPNQTEEPLIQKLQRIAFDLEEEEGLNIAVVAGRVQRSLDVDRLTKRFYDCFKKEHDTFLGFIEGIAGEGDREWYASLMLNRLMFVYFIQKKGFLDGDLDYLRSRLAKTKQTAGKDKFQKFYRLFLLRLFHEGLGQPESNRAPELAQLLGTVPFLNGGLFAFHDLEKHNSDIHIPDEAFEKLFDFFDGYAWHLDDRPLRADNEINPDVLGYIFEKYINQKELGAYYTKEDITGYISRNTIIPSLFDSARKECPVAFQPDGGVWRLLQEDPDRYIYPAVKKGVKLPLPAAIDAGRDEVSQREGWNRPAADEYALPTETWREVVARRKRYEEVFLKLAGGEVNDINELLNLNLDICRFAEDVIIQSEGPELVRTFWHALEQISVLDPACGSGAFLFAALNVLEPLYTACIEGMRGFLDDLARSGERHRPEKLSDFQKVLQQADDAKRHPNQRYFILKSIVLNNVFGVDIVEEAVEICKLRLFLKLVAQAETTDQIEPLPDIDFNIRTGNTLVGFTSLDAVRKAITSIQKKDASQGKMLLFEDEQKVLQRIEEDAEVAHQAFVQFKESQNGRGMDADKFVHAKVDLRKQLDDLGEELDQYLAAECGINWQDSKAYDYWKTSHQPFHWFVEFYGIMHQGGFDVVLGNPPYVSSASLGYEIDLQSFGRFPDIYAYVVIQSQRIRSSRGRSGFIMPLSVAFSYEFTRLREELTRQGSNWFSSYDNIPAALFSGVSQRCTIWLGDGKGKQLCTTRLLRWRSAYRQDLFENISYAKLDGFETESFGIPRLADRGATKLLKLHVHASSSRPSFDPGGLQVPSPLGFSSTARNFISTYLEAPPVVDAEDGKLLEPSQGGWLDLPFKANVSAALAATSGDACFWYWLTRGDGFHVTNWLLKDWLAPLKNLPGGHLEHLTSIGELLHWQRYRALVFKKNAGKYVGNYNYQHLKQLTRRADIIFLAGLGAGWHEIQQLIAHVSLVRAINEEAGEKNIPPEIKDRFSPPKSSAFDFDHRIREIDEWIGSLLLVDPETVHIACGV